MAVYNPGFAHIYNVRWADFARGAAPLIQNFYEERSPEHVGRRLLDLCCGTGQLALHFLAQGYEVLGIDLSPAMLSYAEVNARTYVESGRARFVEGDAADFAVAEEFGLVVSTYDALNHLPGLGELQSCFRCVSSALVDKGWFIFDLNTIHGLRNQWTGVEVKDSEELTLFTRGILIEEQGRAYTCISGFMRREDGFYERFSQTAFNSLFSMDAVETALRASGFSNVHFAKLRALDQPLETPETEMRVWIVARK